MTLAILTIFVMASLVITEVLLCILLKQTNREVRTIRAQLPKAIGLVVGLVLLIEAAKLAAHRRD